MKTSLSAIIIALIALPLLLSACKGKGNPLDYLAFKAPPLAKDSTTIETSPGLKDADRDLIIDNPDDERLPLDFGSKPRPQGARKKLEGGIQDVPIIPMPILPPVLPNDDFGNIVPLNWAFAQCGNNILTQQVLEDGTIVGEECEDGNAQNGDGCSSTCYKEFCGNGRVEPTEECDPGEPPTSPPTVPPLWNHAIPTDECDEFCELIICGDGKVNGPEECDDCNRLDCDGCSSKCTLEKLSEPPCNFICNPTSVFTCPTPTPQPACSSTVTCVVCGTPPNTVCCPGGQFCNDVRVCAPCPNTLCNGVCCVAGQGCVNNICI